MFMFNILYISITLAVVSASEICQNKEKSNCSLKESVKESNIYSKESNTKYLKYLNLIEEARKKYIPCSASKCGCHSPVITHDLKIFKERGGISKQLIESVRSKGTTYQIIDHRLYREKDCMFPARCAGIEHFLLKLAPKLPNLEFVINTRDWPQISRSYGVFGPVFSFSKTQDYHDIMYPAWAFWEGGPAISLYPRGIGRWDTHRKLLGKIGNETAWEDKMNKAFFRGSRTSAERDPLVRLSREKPELVDAQYTKNQAWKSDEDTLHQPPAAEITFGDHCKYKYLFNFRGVAASFRFKHILLCKSVVFHVGSEWLEFFYPALKPWIHYIPVATNSNKDQIEDILNFARNNDDIVRDIANKGYEMIWNNLKLSDVTCYWRKLLKQYASLLKFEPKLNRELVEISPRKD